MFFGLATKQAKTFGYLQFAKARYGDPGIRANEVHINVIASGTWLQQSTT